MGSPRRRPIATLATECVHTMMEEILVDRGERAPLLDELVPFLVARSGQALDEFCRSVAPLGPSGTPRAA